MLGIAVAGTGEFQLGRNKSYNKKVGLFSRKNPTFGVWLPIVDELRTFDDILDWTGIDSCKQ